MNTILTEEEHNHVLDVIQTIGLIGDLLGQQAGSRLSISANNLSSLVTMLEGPLRTALDAAGERGKQAWHQPVLIGLSAFDLSFLMQACIEGRRSVGQNWVDRLTKQFDVAVTVDPDMSGAARQWAELLAADAAPAPATALCSDDAPARRTRRKAAAPAQQAAA